MKRSWLTRLTGSALLAAVLACGLLDAPSALAAESIEDLGSRFQNQLHDGKYDEAAQTMQQIIAMAEQQLGPDDPKVADAVESLGTLYTTQNRNAEAEPYFRRALAIKEKTLGADHPEVATLLISLANAVQNLGRYPEAETLARRAVEIREKALGPDHPDLAAALNLLGNFNIVQGRLDEAERLLLRALAIREKALGPEDQLVAQTLNNIAAAYQYGGRYSEAEALAKRSLAIWEKLLPPDHGDIAVALNALAQIDIALGRYDEAEPYLKRSQAILEKAYGPDDRRVAVAISNLAALYQTQGRMNEAAPLFLRSIDILKKILGPDHIDVATALNNVAFVYHQQRRYDDAADLFKRTIEIMEKALGPDHPSVATAQSNLGMVYNDADKPIEAEPLLRQAAAILEKTLGPDHVKTATALGNLAYSLQLQGRSADAVPYYERALGILERALGPDHPDVSVVLDSLGTLYFEQGQLEKAAGYWRRSTNILIRRTQRGSESTGTRLISKSQSETERESYRFRNLIKALYRLDEGGKVSHSELVEEAFTTAQWALGSDTAETLAQMAARGAKGDPALSRIVRERQDLVGEWQLRDKGLTEAVSRTPENRDAEVEAAFRARLAAIDTRIGEIDLQMQAEFPDYSLLANAAPLSVGEVQSFLNPDEALVIFLDTEETKPAPEESFIWLVTKTGARWARSELGTAAIAREVHALRCGLDEAAWDAGDCAALTGVGSDGDNTAPPRPLPFDHARAHKLYQVLFGKFEDLIEGKQLLLVPAGALRQLPFQVLVKTLPSSGDQKRADWLIRHHAMTVLPAVSSLKALRRVARASAAKRPLVGFGNPLLEGPDRRYAKWAAKARAYRSCKTPDAQQIASLDLRRDVLPVAKRGALTDPEDIRFQVPLPETADELCAVAQNVGAEPRDIHLGAEATEREIKSLSDSGALAQYRIVHFATHGAMAGQLGDGAEPGLILTPPNAASELDDGYLTSSEIAGLKLDADWVILSACNTAAGNNADAEALSGLARAFIYAQARALLVSHWSVASHAAVTLVTTAMHEMAQDTKMGRAEALRQAMLTLIDTGKPQDAHPSVWAPFVVVGEGGR